MLLNLLILSLTVFILSLITYHYNIHSPHLCESTSESNLFWEITQRESRSWNVFFRNVNVLYVVTESDIPNDNHNQIFRFRQVAPFTDAQATGNSPTAYSRRPLDTLPVVHIRTNNNVGDAVMAHFNSIQRGEFHPNLPNVINPNAHGRGIRSPLDQFEIRDFLSFNAPLLANIHLSFTNIGLYLTIATFSALALNFLATNYNKIIANKWSISQESIYATVYSIVINQINATTGQKYYPFIYCLFIFILMNNLIGMVPYSFASTSHFILTFFISFTVVLGATIIGFTLHKLGFFSLFVPAGCPLGLLPLLVLIEFISYLARNVSLGLRLAANVLSGHMLLNILSEFTYNIMDTNVIYFFLGLIPLIFIVAFSGLELGIAFIQAQVFVVLSSSYIKDTLELH